MNETGNVGHIGAETVPSFLALLHRRPRVALRRATDPKLRCAVQAFIFNWRHPIARDKALETVKSHL